MLVGAACPAACGAEGGGDDPASGSVTPAARGRTADLDPLSPGPRHIRRTKPLAHRVGGDDRTVEIVYGRGGNQEPHRVVVRLTPRAALFAVELRSPRAVTYDLRLECATVRLDEPLGGRAVRAARTRRRVPTFERASLVAREAAPVVCG